MRTRKGRRPNSRDLVVRAAGEIAADERSGRSTTSIRDTLIARLTDLHGRSSEIVRRMTDDARTLADVQRETSAVLSRLWDVRSEALRPSAPTCPSPTAVTSVPSTLTNEPRFLRFPEVAKRVGLSRSSVWRLQRAGQFPQHRRLSPNTVGWWEPDVEAWLRARGER